MDFFFCEDEFIIGASRWSSKKKLVKRLEIDINVCRQDRYFRINKMQLMIYNLSTGARNLKN